MRKKVTIIGAGPGGLACGMILSSKGYEVEIYEKKPFIGGRNSSFTLGEYTFDLGPTFFLMKNILEEIFEETGKKLHDYVKLIELKTMYRLKYKENRELYLFRDLEKIEKSLNSFSNGAYEKYKKYLSSEEIKYKKIIPCLSIPYSSFFDLFRPQFIKAIPWIDAHVSLFDVLKRYFDDPELRLAFTFQSKYIGMSPWEAPGTFSILSYIEHGGGIYHVEGGVSKLSQAIAKVIKENGGKIYTSTPVKKIIVKNKKAVGVELENGEKIYTDYVVINADFANAMINIIDPKDRKKYTDIELSKKKYSCSTFMIYLGVKKIWKEFPHHNIIFADDYKKNVDDIIKYGNLSEDPSFYIQNASVTDSTLAPEGKSTIYILVPVPNNSYKINWDNEKDRFKNLIIDLAEKKAGFKDLRKNIEFERIITPNDWEKDMDIYLGAVFNLSHNIRQMLFLRPHNKFEEFDNCYLVGGGTHPGSGLPTIYQSAKISSELIMKDK